MGGNPDSKTAIVVYSYSGHSARLAKRLAEALTAPIIELRAPRYRLGPFGYMRAGFDSLRQAVPKDRDLVPDLATYSHVILCGPVWTSYPSLPLRAVLSADGVLPHSVALFLTCGGHSPPEKAYAKAKRDLGRPFTATAALTNNAEGTQEEDRIVDEFLNTFTSVVPLPQ